MRKMPLSVVRFPLSVLLLGLGIALNGCTEGEAAPLSGLLDPDWAADSFWDDGKAEVATYEASRVIYGEDRPHTATLITVSEPHLAGEYVKADWPYDGKQILPAMKQNTFAVIPTDNYPYHFMVSTFTGRETGELFKMTVSSQEWCGITTKNYELWSEPARFQFISYWEGEGTGEAAFPAPDNAFFEEELPLVLRGLPFEEGLTAEFELFGNQTSSRAPVPQSSPATMNVVETESSDFQVQVSAEDGRELSFLFQAEYPHVLLRFVHSDGRTLALQGVERDAYWER